MLKFTQYKVHGSLKVESYWMRCLIWMKEEAVINKDFEDEEDTDPWLEEAKIVVLRKAPMQEYVLQSGSS